MTCKEVNEHLDRAHQNARGALPVSVREHLEHCQACAALWTFLARKEDGSVATPQVRERIREGMLASLQPVKPLPSASLLVVGFLGTFAALTALFVGFLGIQGAAAMALLPFAGMLAAIAVVSFLLAAALSREMAPGQRRFMAPGVLVALSVVSLVLPVAVLFPWQGSILEPVDWHCFRAGFGLSLPAAGVMVMLLWRGAVLSPGFTGAIVGLLAGLAGTTVLHFGCQLHQAPHIMFSHLGIPLAGAVLGYVVGRSLPVLTAKLRSTAAGD